MNDRRLPGWLCLLLLGALLLAIWLYPASPPLANTWQPGDAS